MNKTGSPSRECSYSDQGRSQTFIPGGPSGRQGGQAVDKGGQAKFSKYFSLVENHLKLVLKFYKEIILQINTKMENFVKF